MSLNPSLEPFIQSQFNAEAKRREEKLKEEDLKRREAREARDRERAMQKEREKELVRLRKQNGEESAEVEKIIPGSLPLKPAAHRTIKKEVTPKREPEKERLPVVLHAKLPAEQTTSQKPQKGEKQRATKKRKRDEESVEEEQKYSFSSVSPSVEEESESYDEESDGYKENDEDDRSKKKPEKETKGRAAKDKAGGIAKVKEAAELKEEMEDLGLISQPSTAPPIAHPVHTPLPVVQEPSLPPAKGRGRRVEKEMEGFIVDEEEEEVLLSIEEDWEEDKKSKKAKGKQTTAATKARQTKAPKGGSKKRKRNADDEEDFDVDEEEDERPGKRLKFEEEVDTDGSEAVDVEEETEREDDISEKEMEVEERGRVRVGVHPSHLMEEEQEIIQSVLEEDEGETKLEKAFEEVAKWRIERQAETREKELEARRKVEDKWKLKVKPDLENFNLPVNSDPCRLVEFRKEKSEDKVRYHANANLDPTQRSREKPTAFAALPKGICSVFGCNLILLRNLVACH